ASTFRPERPPSGGVLAGRARERRMRGRHPPLPRLWAFLARAVRCRAEVAEHEVANLAAEFLAGHEVDHGVLTGEEPAERCLVGCRLEAAEGPGHAGISVRADG